MKKICLLFVIFMLFLPSFCVGGDEFTDKEKRMNEISFECAVGGYECYEYELSLEEAQDIIINSVLGDNEHEFYKLCIYASEIGWVWAKGGYSKQKLYEDLFYLKQLIMQNK